MDKLRVSKVYVLHVQEGYEDRLHSIEKQFNRHKIKFELILEGDTHKIETNDLDTYFTGEMYNRGAVTSCALKHLLAYEDIVKSNIHDALIFEDDIQLESSFNTVFNHTIAEARVREDIREDLLFVSYENSTFKAIGKSKRIPGQFLYLAPATRCAGAYYLTGRVASAILESAKTEKCDMPIDWYHNEILQKKGIPIYWCEPPQAEQGSHNGLFKSAIDQKKSGKIRQFTWMLVKKYKSLLYKWQ